MRVRDAVLLAGTLALLICCVLPWYTHDTAGFSMHLYDLAEWTSLHPAVRSSQPALLTSWLLRMPLWGVVVALVLAANGLRDPRERWIVRGGALAVALWFVPPVEFFSSARGDPNYRQMALLALLSIGAWIAGVGAERLPDRWRTALFVGVLAIGAVSGWWGLARAQELFDNFEIAVRIGVGAWVYAAVAALSACVALWPAAAQPVPPKA